MPESRQPQPADIEPSDGNQAPSVDAALQSDASADDAVEAAGEPATTSPDAAEQHTAAADAGNKKKRKKKKKAQRALASGRGIDTLFRNTCREQLELTSLADSKANIMIQLNAIIVSIMLASSGVVMDTQPRLRLPSAALTFTALISIVFAVLAARPNLNKPKPVTFDEVRSGKANILFFGNFAQLSEQQFIDGMWEMFGETDRIYLNMTRHVHGLGTVLLRKFRLLRIAYTVFLSGLFLSALLFAFTLYAIANDANKADDQRGADRLEGMYEPSGVVQLADGRLLIVEDEPERPMALFMLNPAGRPVLDSGLDLRALLSAHDAVLNRLDDLEGAAFDTDTGFIYAITSFSGSLSKKPRKRAREMLVRFKMDGVALSQAHASSDIGGLLRQRAGGRINVEGLAFDEAGKRLLVGLRTPLRGDKSLVIPIDGPDSCFGGAPSVGEAIELDMAGDSIRGMTYDAHLGGFVLIGHREGDNKAPFNLWRWDGDHPPERVHINGVELRMAEGVTPITFNGEERLLIVCDDGNRAQRKAASYVLLRYDQLSLGS